MRPARHGLAVPGRDQRADRAAERAAGRRLRVLRRFQHGAGQRAHAGQVCAARGCRAGHDRAAAGHAADAERGRVRLLAILCAELVLIGALSPEVGEGLIRLGYSEPCELRDMPATRTLMALRRSKQWRRYAGLITSDVPADVWRELCWRYVVYPSSYDGRPADLVFAVFLQQRRPAIHAALVDCRHGPAAALAHDGRRCRRPAPPAGAAPLRHPAQLPAAGHVARRTAARRICRSLRISRLLAR